MGMLILQVVMLVGLGVAIGITMWLVHECTDRLDIHARNLDVHLGHNIKQLRRIEDMVTTLNALATELDGIHKRVDEIDKAVNALGVLALNKRAG